MLTFEEAKARYEHASTIKEKRKCYKIMQDLNRLVFTKSPIVSDASNIGPDILRVCANMFLMEHEIHHALPQYQINTLRTALKQMKNDGALQHKKFAGYIDAKAQHSGLTFHQMAKFRNWLVSENRPIAEYHFRNEQTLRAFAMLVEGYIK